MDGSMTAPIAAVVAGLEPEMAAKIIDAKMATMDRPPVILPTRSMEKSTSRLEMPPVLMMLPARTKKGIAISGNESTPLNRVWVPMMRGVLLASMMAAIEAKPRQTAMGTPMSRAKAKEAKRMVVIARLPAASRCFSSLRWRI